jgi:hypothetical protein
MGRNQLIALIVKLRPLVPHIHLLKDGSVCMWCRKTLEKENRCDC